MPVSIVQDHDRVDSGSGTGWSLFYNRKNVSPRGSMMRLAFPRYPYVRRVVLVLAIISFQQSQARPSNATPQKTVQEEFARVFQAVIRASSDDFKAIRGTRMAGDNTSHSDGSTHSEVWRATVSLPGAMCSVIKTERTSSDPNTGSPVRSVEPAAYSCTGDYQEEELLHAIRTVLGPDWGSNHETRPDGRSQIFYFFRVKHVSETRIGPSEVVIHLEPS
jgi:hypothetical protein